MFSLIPYVFGFLSRERFGSAKIVQLLKEYGRQASLGFSKVNRNNELFDCEETKKEVVFSKDGVNAFKIEPSVVISKQLHQSYNWNSFELTKEESQIYFILQAATYSKHENLMLIKPKEQLNDTLVCVLAWRTLSNNLLTLLASTSEDNYAELGSAFINKHFKTFKNFDVLEMLTVNYVTHKAKVTGRPPNVLVYTGDDEQGCERFQVAKEFLKKCLGQDSYVIYQLQKDLVSQEPWKENTELLIIASDTIIEKSHESRFESYVKNGGKLLSFSKLYTFNGAVTVASCPSDTTLHLCEKLGDYGECLHIHGIDTVFEVKEEENAEVLAVRLSTSQPVVISILLPGDGKAVLSTTDIFTATTDEGIDNERKQFLKMLLNFLGVICGGRPEKSALTNAYLLAAEKDKEIFLKSIQDVVKDNCFKGSRINIHFNKAENKETLASNDNFSVITSPNSDQVSFNLHLYKEYLKTNHLGKVVIYSEVVTSTQTILNGSLRLIQKLPHGSGLVVVGRQQTVGKGRGGNAWLSPDGCLSFSFPLQINLDSNLGQRLPFLQHIAALAVVEAVRRLRSYEDIDIRVKWPNDIYFGKDTKIGGILVNSSLQGRSLYAVIGIGVNVDNSKPTTCINDIVEQQDKTLRKLSKEQLLARIFNEMEEIVQDFQNYGSGGFLQKYYLRWLHSDAKVKLENEKGEEVTIKGLDDMGFLSVINSMNEVQSVQPDGNSFDMMRNLITMKSR